MLVHKKSQQLGRAEVKMLDVKVSSVRERIIFPASIPHYSSVFLSLENEMATRTRPQKLAPLCFAVQLELIGTAKPIEARVKPKLLSSSVRAFYLFHQ